MVLVYISAPIIKKTSRKDEFCSFVVAILEDLGFNIFAPQFLGPAEPEEIFRRDVYNLRMCDFVITEIKDNGWASGKAEYKNQNGEEVERYKKNWH